MIQITYPGSGNNSQFVYDGLNQNAQIVETNSGSATSTKRFVWSGNQRCEERDGSGTLTKQFYAQGQIDGVTDYFFAKDHLTSVHEITDSSGGIQAEYKYDPYGRLQKISESQSSDFGFCGYYSHSRSGLLLTLFRSYSVGLGRWISRDPINESGGTNLFDYAFNNSVGLFDPLGLQGVITYASSAEISAMTGVPEGFFGPPGPWASGLSGGKGCRSLVDYYVNLPKDGFPATAPNSTCWYGNAATNKNNINNVDCCGKKKIVWTQTGKPANGRTLPDSGPVIGSPADVFSGSPPYSYYVLAPNLNQFVGLIDRWGGSVYAPGTCPGGGPGSNTMTCVTCVKK